MASDAPSDNPPTTLPVVAAGIPDDVRALSQFVVWSWEYRDNHWRKPPLRADGLGYAASNDARTWACCDVALAAYQRRDLGGIGFAIASDDPFFFIDLDDCRDPLTGDVDSWAAQVLDRFQHTYQEVSPSATGFKILGLGTPPVDQYVQPIAGARPRAKVEVFASIKYTTLSGHRLLEAPAAVSDAQSALNGLYTALFPRQGSEHGPRPCSVARQHDDDACLDRARNASNGAEFCLLFDAGDLSGHGQDPRRGDQALVAMLAVWFGPDRACLDRAFRRSALMREAWDTRPDGSCWTYGDGVIDAVLADHAGFAAPMRPRSRHFMQRRESLHTAAVVGRRRFAGR